MRLSPRHPLTSRALARLQDESGIALVMALGVMLVLAIVLTTTIFFTSASVRHANTSNAGQKAYTIAEAGLNNAISQLAPYYAAATAMDGGTGGSISGSSPSFPGGTVSWTGIFDGTSIWSLTGTGTVKNPTGGADITRTARAKLLVSQQPPPFTKYGLFVDDAPGCTRLTGQTTITVPVYSAGCLDLRGGAGIEEPASSGQTPATTTVSVNLGGELKGGVGTSGKKINWLAAYGGCNGGPCTNGVGGVYAHTIGTYAPVSLPVVDADAQYAKAKWSAATCTGPNPFDKNNARNNSGGNATLDGGLAYDCTARDTAGNFVGRLAWTPSTRTLQVSGTIFIDDDLDAPELQYTGNGTIYFNGTMELKKAKICGPSSSGGPGLVSGSCTKTWSPLGGYGALLLVAINANNAGNAINFQTGTEIEAGLWAVGNVDGSSHPYLGGSVYIDEGTGDFTGGGAMQAFINLPAGAPTGGQWSLGTPYEYK